MGQRKVNASPGPSPSAPPASPENLTSQTLRGVQWTYIGTAATGLLQMISAAVLGRLLTPAAFGLVAMALLALQFTNTFARMGLGPALVQKRDLSPDEIRAGLTSSVGLGTLVAGLVWIASPLVGSAFGEPEVVPVLRAMGLTLIIHGAGLPAESLLRRQLRFRERESIRVASYGLGYLAVGCVGAVLGAGVWSLVIANLIQTGMCTVLYYHRTRHPLRPIFRWSAYKDLYGFGSRVSLISVLEYVGLNLDTFAVGRYATAAILGQYSRAFVLVGIPVRQLNHGLATVLLPSFSKLQDDVQRLRRAYVGGVSAAAAIIVPLCAGMAVASREIVLVVLGPQWEPVIAILPLIALASALGALTHFAAIVAEAQAELNKKFVLQGSYVVLLGLFLLPALGRDLWAYAAAYAAARVFQHVGFAFLMRATVYLPLGQHGRILGRASAAGCFTALLIFLGQRGMVALDAPLPLILGTEVALGALSMVVQFRFGTLRPLANQLRGHLDRAGVHQSSFYGRAARLVLGHG